MSVLFSSGHTELVAIAEQETKERFWHRQFGHIGVKNLQQLPRQKLVNGSKQHDFCETCVEGKNHGSIFPTKGSSRKEAERG